MAPALTRQRGGAYTGRWESRPDRHASSGSRVRRDGPCRAHDARVTVGGAILRVCRGLACCSRPRRRTTQRPIGSTCSTRIRRERGAPTCRSAARTSCTPRRPTPDARRPWSWTSTAVASFVAAAALARWPVDPLRAGESTFVVDEARLSRSGVRPLATDRARHDLAPQRNRCGRCRLRVISLPTSRASPDSASRLRGSSSMVD